MHKILVIRLYFLLDALHVSEYISLSSGAKLYIAFWCMPVPKSDVQLIKVAPEDGLTQSETCRAYNGK